MADVSLFDTACYMSGYTLRGLRAALIANVSQATLCVGIKSEKPFNIAIPMNKEQISRIEAAKNDRKIKIHISMVFSSYQLATARLIDGSGTIHQGTLLVVPKKTEKISPSVSKLLMATKKSKRSLHIINPNKVVILTEANVDSLSDDYLAELHGMLSAAIARRSPFISSTQLDEVVSDQSGETMSLSDQSGENKSTSNTVSDEFSMSYCQSCCSYTEDSLMCTACHERKQLTWSSDECTDEMTDTCYSNTSMYLD